MIPRDYREFFRLAEQLHNEQLKVSGFKTLNHSYVYNPDTKWGVLVTKELPSLLAKLKLELVDTANTELK